MTQQTFILRESAGRVELMPDVGLTHAKADAMVSRLNFKADGWQYCVFTGIFQDAGEARHYAQLRCKGLSPERAWREVLEARRTPAASTSATAKRATWRSPRAAKHRAQQ